MASYSWAIDVDSPASACTVAVCTDPDVGRCASGSGASTNYVLVMSDEFQEDGRKFGADDGDRLWTAQDLYYFPTQDYEVYKPEQVTTQNGAVVVTIEQKAGTAPTQQPDGSVYDVSKAFVSGMATSWNKFCYTGGYLEASVKMPGDWFYSGFWPAIWAMGNLGKAGYMQSTQGFWPYSYSECAESGPVSWSSSPGQTVTACPNPPPDYLQRFGFQPGQGRGAPEWDMFEMSVPSSLDNPGTPDNPGSSWKPPYVSQTLQMATLQPPGTPFMTQGVAYPGSGSSFATRLNPWQGIYGRPGNVYQDSFSAVSSLDKTFFERFHTFGVDWAPGQHLRWLIDGQVLFELTQQALAAVSNATGASVGQRLIPVEPVYLIFNLGMSDDFTPVDKFRLPFPSKFEIDYLRVYQDPASIDVGCSPKGFPTEQYIACNSDTYSLSKADDKLVNAECQTSGSRRATSHWALPLALAASAAAALLLA